jgi:hypothetical protein
VQQPTSAPRGGLTEAAVLAVIEHADLVVDARLVLVTDGEEVDLTRYLDPEGSYLERSNYAEVHGTCKLRLDPAAPINWSRARVRVTLTLSAGGTEFTVDDGVYLLDTPATTVGEDVVEVTGFDLVDLLGTSVGRTFRAPAGDGHLETVIALLAEAGVDEVVVDDLTSDPPIPADRLWPLDEKNTYLLIVNELLDACGRRGVWIDWNGRARLERYVSPEDREPEHAYDTTSATSIVDDEDPRRMTQNLGTVPTDWVFYRDDPELGLPEVDDGIYEVHTDPGEPTSSIARGRIVRRVVKLDVADHDALVAAGDRIVAADRNVAREFEFSTGPNPLHWHFDVLELTDHELPDVDRLKVVSTWWKLPLDGSPMQHKAKEV